MREDHCVAHYELMKDTYWRMQNACEDHVCSDTAGYVYKYTYSLTHASSIDNAYNGVLNTTIATEAAHG